MTNKNLTIELNDLADAFTPVQIGTAIAAALSWGTDDSVGFYTDEAASEGEIVCPAYNYANGVETPEPVIVGTYTIGAK